MIHRHAKRISTFHAIHSNDNDLLTVGILLPSGIKTYPGEYSERIVWFQLVVDTRNMLARAEYI